MKVIRLGVTRVRQWKLAERGFSTAAIAIIALPLLMMALGVGFDIARLNFIRNMTQSHADLSAQSAVNLAYTSSDGKLQLTSNALPEAKKLYCDNTGQLRPGMLSGSCNPTSSQEGGPLDVNQFCSPLNITSPTRYGLKLEATETVIPVFMKVAGIKQFDMKITTTALLRARTC